MPLLNNTITVFSVVREGTLGMGDWTSVAEQDNFPELEEFSTPVGAWSWSVDNGGAGAKRSARRNVLLK